MLKALVDGFCDIRGFAVQAVCVLQTAMCTVCVWEEIWPRYLVQLKETGSVITILQSQRNNVLVQRPSQQLEWGSGVMWGMGQNKVLSCRKQWPTISVIKALSWMKTSLLPNLEPSSDWLHRRHHAVSNPTECLPPPALPPSSLLPAPASASLTSQRCLFTSGNSTRRWEPVAWAGNSPAMALWISPDFTVVYCRCVLSDLYKRSNCRRVLSSYYSISSAVLLGMNAAVRAAVRMGIYVGAKVYFIHEVRCGHRRKQSGAKMVLTGLWLKTTGCGVKWI